VERGRRRSAGEQGKLRLKAEEVRVERLFVVIGAGASHDCSSPVIPPGDGPKPPLVTDLFAPYLMNVLGSYPAAQAAGAEIRKHGRDAQAIERFIRERYRDSSNEADRRKYKAIPCYLQDLLHRVSTTYTTQPDNYDLLVTVLTRLPEVVFVTLTYDTLLDDRLHETVGPITSLADYVDPDRNWGLVKLHGSVNWGCEIMDKDRSVNFRDVPPDLTVADTIEWRGGFGTPLNDLRLQSGKAWYYPVLAVPVGEEDELVCPPEHVAWLKDKLATADGAHLLVIGYSGYDQEVLSVFRDCETPVRSLYVVNKNAETAEAVVSQLGPDLGIGVPSNSWCEVGFGDFVQSERFDRYVGELQV
jgi:hypothetical protein